MEKNWFVNKNTCALKKVGNPSDLQAMVMKKEISHVLQVVAWTRCAKGNIIDLFNIHQARWGVTGPWCYSSDLPQGGLEFPCVLTFIVKELCDN